MFISLTTPSFSATQPFSMRSRPQRYCQDRFGGFGNGEIERRERIAGLELQYPLPRLKLNQFKLRRYQLLFLVGNRKELEYRRNLIVRAVNYILEMLEYLRNLSAGREESVNYFCRQFAVAEELGELLFSEIVSFVSSFGFAASTFSLSFSISCCFCSICFESDSS